jgi:hypothetical protein
MGTYVLSIDAQSLNIDVIGDSNILRYNGTGHGESRALSGSIGLME